MTERPLIFYILLVILIQNKKVKWIKNLITLSHRCDFHDEDYCPECKWKENIAPTEWVRIQ